MNKVYNLSYFIAAIDRPMLWFNLWNLKKNLHLFNGKKLVTIAYMDNGPMTLEFANLSKDDLRKSVYNRTELIKRIINYLEDDRIDFRVIPNSQHGETDAFIYGMGNELSSINPDEVTFYGHTKGVRYPELRPTMGMWAGIMYRYCFNFEDVEDKLWNQNYSTYGALKRDGLVYEWSETGGVNWHYSGGMFWFKHTPFFSSNWKCMDRNKGVMEYIIPRVISTQDAYCPFYLPFEFRVGGDFYHLDRWEYYFRNNNLPGINEQMNSFGFDGTMEGGFSFDEYR